MIEASVVREAHLPPGMCLLCSSQEGPFVDTGIELGEGSYFRTQEERDAARADRRIFGLRVYVCGECANAIARPRGWQPPEDVRALEETVTGQLERIAVLEAELERERDNKFVPIAEVRELVGASMSLSVPTTRGGINLSERSSEEPDGA